VIQSEQSHTRVVLDRYQSIDRVALNAVAGRLSRALWTHRGESIVERAGGTQASVLREELMYPAQLRLDVFELWASGVAVEQQGAADVILLPQARSEGVQNGAGRPQHHRGSPGASASREGKSPSRRGPEYW
jgi:hypothetical protein